MKNFFMRKLPKLNKKTIGIILAATVVFIVIIVVWGVKQNQKIRSAATLSQAGDVQADIVYYYGQECPHCKNVEKFIADNNLDQKISFAKKEVWHNSANDNEMNEKAGECLLDPSKVGVPFLWARGKCYVGEIEVENFFKKEASIK